MKKLLALLLALPLMAHAQVDLELLWETEGLRTPESVLFYPGEGDVEAAYLLVAEIEGEGEALDGKGGIAKLSLEGEILDKNWVRGLNAPKGMGIADGILYVADVLEVVAIDIKTQEIVDRVEVPDAIFLNDIAVDKNNVVYVSDTRTNKVHRIVDGEVEEFLTDIPAANGLTVVGPHLYVAGGDSLWRATADGYVAKVAEGFAEGADGVEMIGDDGFIVTAWAGLVYHVTPEGEVKKLMDSRDPRTNTADLGWNPTDEVIYIPTFFSDSVKAYKVK